MRVILHLGRKWKRQRSATTLLALCAVAAMAAVVQAQPHPTEYQVKAAYLYNFGKFMNWNRPGDAQFDVCILGEDPFGSDFDSVIANATINGKKVAGHRIAKAQDGEGCEIAFIAQSEGARLDRDLAALNKLKVLTVSDIPDFLQHGGIIQFVEADHKVRFEVNLKAAEEDGFTLSSELLKVALKVQR